MLSVEPVPQVKGLARMRLILTLVMEMVDWYRDVVRRIQVSWVGVAFGHAESLSLGLRTLAWAIERANNGLDVVTNAYLALSSLDGTASTSNTKAKGFSEVRQNSKRTNQGALEGNHPDRGEEIETSTDTRERNRIRLLRPYT